MSNINFRDFSTNSDSDIAIEDTFHMNFPNKLSKISNKVVHIENGTLL